MIKKINFQNPHVIGRLVLWGVFIVGLGLSCCWCGNVGMVGRWFAMATIFPLFLFTTAWKYLLPVVLTAVAMIYFGSRSAKKVVVILGYVLFGGLWLFLVAVSCHFRV